MEGYFESLVFEGKGLIPKHHVDSPERSDFRSTLKFSIFSNFSKKIIRKFVEYSCVEGKVLPSQSLASIPVNGKYNNIRNDQYEREFLVIILDCRD